MVSVFSHFAAFGGVGTRGDLGGRGGGASSSVHGSIDVSNERVLEIDGRGGGDDDDEVLGEEEGGVGVVVAGESRCFLEGFLGGLEDGSCGGFLMSLRLLAWCDLTLSCARFPGGLPGSFGGRGGARGGPRRVRITGTRIDDFAFNPVDRLRGFRGRSVRRLLRG